jgi:hypothetical protein
MNHTSGEKFDIREEFRLIPKVMIVVAVLVFLGMQALFILVAFRHDPHAPPVAVQVLIATLPGCILGFFMLLVGYVNRDAKRRGMNYVLWTVLVILIPNAIGFIFYFLVRHPLMARCPQCGATVNLTFSFCPRCRFSLRPTCPSCRRALQVGDVYCPFCATELKAPA